MTEPSSPRQYTPGPWQMLDTWDGLFIVQERTVAPYIAEIKPGDDQWANARLIAWTPELLDTCVQLLDICREVCSPRNEAHHAVLVRACEVIVKATYHEATNGELPHYGS